MSRLDKCWYKEVCTIENCTEHCIRYTSMLSLMTQSNIPEYRQMPATLFPEDCDIKAFELLKEIKDDVVNFVNNGENLYIFSSNTGNGKTSWSIKIMLKYFDSVWPGNGDRCRGIFIHVPTFLNQLKNFNVVDDAFNEMKAKLAEVDLVVWDDIASTDLSGYDHGQLLSYIDSRTLNMKSNIFTGNRGHKDIERALGSRLASRIWNTSTIVELRGSDNRQ